MSRIEIKLCEQDCRAIDLLLDGGSSAIQSDPPNLQVVDGMSAGYLPHVNPVEPERIEAVQHVLSALELLPAEEPPPGLVERTLAHIDQSMRSSTHDSFRSPLQADPSIPPA